MNEYKQDEFYTKTTIEAINRVENRSKIDKSEMKEIFMIFFNFSRIFIEIENTEQIEYLITVFKIINEILAESPILRVMFTKFFSADYLLSIYLKYHTIQDEHASEALFQSTIALLNQISYLGFNDGEIINSLKIIINLMECAIPVRFKACLVDFINSNNMIKISIITKPFIELVFTKVIYPSIIMDNEYSVIFWELFISIYQDFDIPIFEQVITVIIQIFQFSDLKNIFLKVLQIYLKRNQSFENESICDDLIELAFNSYESILDEYINSTITNKVDILHFYCLLIVRFDLYDKIPFLLEILEDMTIISDSFPQIFDSFSHITHLINCELDSKGLDLK